jgi:hypothetical protein
MNCVPLPFQRGTVAEMVIMKCLMAADAAAKLSFLSTLDFGAFQMNAFDSNSFQVEALTAVGLVVDIKFQRAQLYHALRFLNQQNLPNSAAGNGVSAVSGDARRFQFTVTTAGTPGANPTMWDRCNPAFDHIHGCHDIWCNAYMERHARCSKNLYFQLYQ